MIYIKASIDLNCTSSFCVFKISFIAENIEILGIILKLLENNNKIELITNEPNILDIIIVSGT